MSDITKKNLNVHFILGHVSRMTLACEQAPKWALGRTEKSARGASRAQSGGERGGGGGGGGGGGEH